MYKLKTKNILVVLGFILLSSTAIAQIPDEIVLSLKTGNDKILTEYFNQNIELVVPGSDDVFSKSQAQQLVARFLKIILRNLLRLFIKEGNKDLIMQLVT